MAKTRRPFATMSEGKARKTLHDGMIHGKPLTARQVRALRARLSEFKQRRTRRKRLRGSRPFTRAETAQGFRRIRPRRRST